MASEVAGKYNEPKKEKKKERKGGLLDEE